MIVFDLFCHAGHRFEGWFGSSGDFADQQDRGLILCPHCGSPEVEKAPMAPAVPAKGNRSRGPAAEAKQLSNQPMTTEVEKALAALSRAQAEALKQSTWVGDRFAEVSRKMHYGEADERPIHGQASLEEARNLVDEGIAVAQLPFPVAPPEKLN